MKDYLDARVEWMDRALAAGATIGMTSKEVKTLNDTGLLDTVARKHSARGLICAWSAR